MKISLAGGWKILSGLYLRNCKSQETLSLVEILVGGVTVKHHSVLLIKHPHQWHLFVFRSVFLILKLFQLWRPFDIVFSECKEGGLALKFGMGLLEVKIQGSVAFETADIKNN